MATGGAPATTARRRGLSKDRAPRSTTRSTRRCPSTRRRGGGSVLLVVFGRRSRLRSIPSWSCSFFQVRVLRLGRTFALKRPSLYLLAKSRAYAAPKNNTLRRGINNLIQHRPSIHYVRVSDHPGRNRRLMTTLRRSRRRLYVRRRIARRRAPA